MGNHILLLTQVNLTTEYLEKLCHNSRMENSENEASKSTNEEGEKSNSFSDQNSNTGEKSSNDEESKVLSIVTEEMTQGNSMDSNESEKQDENLSTSGGKDLSDSTDSYIRSIRNRLPEQQTASFVPPPSFIVEETGWRTIHPGEKKSTNEDNPEIPSINGSVAHSPSFVVDETGWKTINPDEIFDIDEDREKTVLLEKISNKDSNNSNMSEYQNEKFPSSNAHEQSVSQTNLRSIIRRLQDQQTEPFVPPPSCVFEETGWRTVNPGEGKQSDSQANLESIIRRLQDQQTEPFVPPPSCVIEETGWRTVNPEEGKQSDSQ